MAVQTEQYSLSTWPERPFRSKPAAASVFADEMPTTASAPAAAPVKAEQHAKTIKHTKAAPAKKAQAKTEAVSAASTPAVAPAVKK